MIGADVTEHAGQRIAVGVVWWGTPEFTANDRRLGTTSPGPSSGVAAASLGTGWAVPGVLAVVPVVEVGCSWRVFPYRLPFARKFSGSNRKVPTEVPTPPRTVVS